MVWWVCLTASGVRWQSQAVWPGVAGGCIVYTLVGYVTAGENTDFEFVTFKKQTLTENAFLTPNNTVDI